MISQKDTTFLLDSMQHIYEIKIKGICNLTIYFQ